MRSLKSFFVQRIKTPCRGPTIRHLHSIKWLPISWIAHNSHPVGYYHSKTIPLVSSHIFLREPQNKWLWAHIRTRQNLLDSCVQRKQAREILTFMAFLEWFISGSKTQFMCTEHNMRVLNTQQKQVWMVK